MKRIIVYCILFYFFSHPIFSQINVQINVPEDVVITGDTIKLCKTPTYLFTANVTYTDGQEFDIEAAKFEWDFGDGSSASQGVGSAYQTMSHTYESGAYYLKVKVTDQFDVSAPVAIMPVKVSYEPYFLGTTSDIDSICKWDNVNFVGKVLPQTWTYKLPDSVAYENNQFLWNTAPFSSSLYFNLFEQNQKFESLDQLDYIYVDMEHSDMSSLQIELVCPNQTSIILKNRGGDHSYMGKPVDDESKIISVGELFTYRWNTDPEYATLGEEAGKYTYRYIDTDGNEYTNQSYMPEGSYQSYENIDRLIGCPLNGKWELKISDIAEPDNGFLKKWGIVFKEEFELPMWTISHTYSDYEWIGGNISSTSFEGTASDLKVEGQDEELEAGDYSYKFSAIDDYGCKYDTTITVVVQSPLIINETISGVGGGEEGVLQAPVDIKFTADCAWGISFDWSMGDNTNQIEKVFEHTYANGGAPNASIYKVILHAVSEQGCEDSDTLELSVKAPGHEFEIPNIFIPEEGNFKVEMGDNNELDEFQCRIYNRWGQMVYKFYDWNENAIGWNGKINGMDAPEGVYFYFIKYEGKDKEKGKERGFVHLMRNLR